MDWKREAADKLRGYARCQQAVDRLPEEIRRLELQFTGLHSATTDSTPVSGGGSTREDRLLSNITEREELRRNLQQAQLWCANVDKALAVLDPEDRQLLERLYISGYRGAVDRYGEEYHMDRTTVWRRREQALSRFTQAYYGFEWTR